jgi:hypothetical protein
MPLNPAAFGCKILWSNSPIKHSSQAVPELRVDGHTMIGLTMQRWILLLHMRRRCTNGLMDILGLRCTVLVRREMRQSWNRATTPLRKGQGFLGVTTSINIIKPRRSWRFVISIRAHAWAASLQLDLGVLDQHGHREACRAVVGIPNNLPLIALRTGNGSSQADTTAFVVLPPKCPPSVNDGENTMLLFTNMERAGVSRSADTTDAGCKGRKTRGLGVRVLSVSFFGVFNGFGFVDRRNLAVFARCTHSLFACP